MMDKQLEMALAKLLEKAASGIDSASVFLQAQIPDVVHQFLMWRLWESAISNVVAISFAVIAWRLLASLKKPAKNDLNGMMERDFAWLMTFFAFVMSCFMAYKLANIGFIQILVAPKVYLIEQAAKIIKP